jgi:tRNA pseudouridine38-40 synthase
VRIIFINIVPNSQATIFKRHRFLRTGRTLSLTANFFPEIVCKGKRKRILRYQISVNGGNTLNKLERNIDLEFRKFFKKENNDRKSLRNIAPVSIYNCLLLNSIYNLCKPSVF